VLAGPFERPALPDRLAFEDLGHDVNGRAVDRHRLLGDHVTIGDRLGERVHALLDDPLGVDRQQAHLNLVEAVRGVGILVSTADEHHQIRPVRDGTGREEHDDPQDHREDGGNRRENLSNHWQYERQRTH